MSIPLPQITDLQIRLLGDGRLLVIFPYHPERHPGAITNKRWQTLSAEEQAFIAHVEDEMKLRGYSPKTRKSLIGKWSTFSEGRGAKTAIR